MITSKGEALTGMLVNLPSQGDSFTGACSVYTGELERHTNLPIGSGTMHILTDNKTFKGNFLNGQLEGPGSYKDETTGEEFTGNFKKGRVEGQGTHHMPGEFLYEGQFKAGIFGDALWVWDVKKGHLRSEHSTLSDYIPFFGCL